MESILRDIRYGLRSLIKSPGLTIVATLALTLGIGVTVTMFSIVYGALMKGLPYPDGNRIVEVRRENPSRNQRRMNVPISDYEDYRAQQHTLDDRKQRRTVLHTQLVARESWILEERRPLDHGAERTPTLLGRAIDDDELVRGAERLRHKASRNDAIFDGYARV